MKSNRMISVYVSGIFLLTIAFPTFGQKQSKELKTVCIQASMTCMGCKNTIEKNMAFEKGVKAVVANLDNKLVQITYVASKNTPEKLAEAIRNLGYEATVVDEKQCSGIKE